MREVDVIKSGQRVLGGNPKELRDNDSIKRTWLGKQGQEVVLCMRKG
jgi:ABC-type lipopolysaccharide export system ATPase subunit